ncbi:hypothetical protein AB0H36_44090 [Kribbella sp. NPDC050820]|uniref:hypothetical protein n=1 Tax=Kribbella sp. NPDC050820 TaxID=3155408 RepID=UPI0033E9CD97
MTNTKASVTKRHRSMVDGMPMPRLPERAVKAVFLAIICALVVFPFIGVISTSLAPAEEVTKSGGFVMFPTHGIDLSAYRSILSGGTVTQALLISCFITAVGTGLALLLTCTLGWALSRRGSIGNRPLLLLVLISLLFNPGLIPSYGRPAVRPPE